MSNAAIAPGLFQLVDGAPRLVGARRKADAAVVFPAPAGAEAALFEPILLSQTGKLWSFTVQRFRPKSPPYDGAEDEASFKPFAVGYVELPGETIVETRLAVDDFSRLRIGMDMRLVLTPFQSASRGEVTAYAFAPEEDA